LTQKSLPQTLKNRKYERGYLGSYQRLRIGIPDLGSYGILPCFLCVHCAKIFAIKVTLYKLFEVKQTCT